MMYDGPGGSQGSEGPNCDMVDRVKGVGSADGGPLASLLNYQAADRALGFNRGENFLPKKYFLRLYRYPDRATGGITWLQSSLISLSCFKNVPSRYSIDIIAHCSFSVWRPCNIF